MKTNIFIHKKNAIRWLSLLLIGLFTIPAMAETPDPEGAKRFAETFFKANAPNFAPGEKAPTAFALEQRYQTKADKQTPVFVFQNSGKGFAVLAQNGGDFAVVGYSPNGNFKSENIPPQLFALLKLYEDSLKINPSAMPKAPMATPVVEPLLFNAGVRLSQFRHEHVGINMPCKLILSTI
ncbi:MAG: hypothetical protein GX102_06515 [Porphyromonadaceae bacterium]|nr:hypothetical protein [Porphyromonadaceae bacterium]